MRTPEQIANLRKVFTGMYGPVMLFMTSEDIDRMADMVQEAAIEQTKWSWEIRVKTNEDLSKKWYEIEKEPRVIKCSLRTISLKIEKLFPKHPNIAGVLITAKEDEDLVFEFVPPK